MDLGAYFARIAFTSGFGPDLETLTALHCLHANAIAFENLDVQFGKTLTTDVAPAYEKLVMRRRGGWCYEQNGVFGWALGEIGFDVVRVSAGVNREVGGDAQLGNHLCLLVTLEGCLWLADVGFGGSLKGPLRVEAAGRRDAPYDIGLKRAPDDYWRFWESDGGEPISFDFRAASADEAHLSAKCAELQQSPASPFVQNLVVQRRQGEKHICLRGRVLSETRANVRRVMQTPRELVETLRTRFELDAPEAAELWPAICARHRALGLSEL
jgi:N-hydroxyarylamine O-acetyltransferase